MTSVAELQQHFPHIPWHEPIAIEVEGRPPGFACRVCIAEQGFSAAHSPLHEEDEVREHIEIAHL